MVELSEQERIALAYQAVFGTGDGAKVLADLFEFCGLFDPIHQGEATHDTAFFLGARSVALRIREQLAREVGKKDVRDATAES